MKNNGFLSAQRARKKAANIQLGRGHSGAPKARLLNFLTDLAGPVWQTFQGQVVCRSGASLRRRRGRQAVFREQFLAHLGLNWAQRRRQAVFRELFLPTWALTGAQRRRQAVFKEQFLPTWALTGARRRRQAVFKEQFLPTWALTGARRRRQAVFRERF